MSSRTGNDANRSAILAHLGAAGPTSRAGLSRALGVSPALVTALVRGLVADGLVAEGDHDRTLPGRPAKLLSLVGTSGVVIGAKLVADHVAIVEAGVDGTVVRSAIEPWQASAPTAISELVQLLQAFIGRGSERRLLGVGVGVPGQVAGRERGTVTWPAVGWHGTDLGESLSASLEIPVIVDNNVNALALAERLFGHGRRFEDFLTITIGTGIGCAIVLGGSVQRGATGAAGEIGHFPVDDGVDARMCECGNRGCLESVIGQEALIATARSEGALGPRQGIDDLVRRADDGEEPAQRVFGEAGRTLGRTLAGLVNVIDPQAVVLTGEGMPGWRHWTFGFEPAFRGGLLPQRRELRVEIETWQEDRWAQGAAALVLGTPFEADAGTQSRRVRARMAAARPTATRAASADTAPAP
ncbi:ROK family transcriptional regulator [Agrococcus sp. Marseille-P2731]|uniref:ROK family transcriptional regulator n=1 Tax=Agrococcus sp. Marseille-P2731 TaxID=1841862 RepID=UPI0009313074|nr:ROK family transcriptional regulator [Agrococcus sp. Marseille-P2731]